MSSTVGSAQAGRGWGSLFPVSLSALCLFVFTGYLFAQEPKGQSGEKPVQASQKPGPKAASEKPAQQGPNARTKSAQPKVIPAPTPKARPDLSSGPDASGKVTEPELIKRKARSRRGRASAGFNLDPNAKWACDKTVVELEPVWRGKDQLTFPFDIRNEGTADLRFRARGG